MLDIVYDRIFGLIRKRTRLTPFLDVYKRQVPDRERERRPIGRACDLQVASGHVDPHARRLTTYTLSCINSTVPIPDPAQDASPAPQQAAEDGQATVSDPLQQTDSSGRIPIGTLIIFLLGLACAAGGLIALYLSKRRRQPVYEEWDEEDEEDEDY